MIPNSKIIKPCESKLLNVITQVSKEEFDYSWHFHTECELTYIVNGEGHRFVGNNVESFSSDELVLLGSNLPHCWINDNKTWEHHPFAIVAYLKEDLFEGSWFNSSEFEAIRNLLELSKRGIKFNLNTSLSLKEKCFALTELNSLNKLTCLMNILQELSELSSDNYSLLCRQPYSGELNTINNERINSVYRYIENNYEKGISLANVAEEIHMSAGYFSRFFSKEMKKPFFEFLNEYRINQACKQLIESEKLICDICYDVGYESIPYFNRQFKKIKGYTPQKFRQNYSKAFV